MTCLRVSCHCMPATPSVPGTQDHQVGVIFNSSVFCRREFWQLWCWWGSHMAVMHHGTQLIGLSGIGPWNRILPCHATTTAHSVYDRTARSYLSSDVQRAVRKQQQVDCLQGKDKGLASVSVITSDDQQMMYHQGTEASSTPGALGSINLLYGQHKTSLGSIRCLFG